MRKASNSASQDGEGPFGVPSNILPMEAKRVDVLPPSPGWQYEPKWDGFRCLAMRNGETIELRSKSGKPLGRYFPEVVARLDALAARRFVIDGELVIPSQQGFSFGALQARLHPAESRIRRLAAQTPASLLLFDCLVTASGETLMHAPLTARRHALEIFFAAQRLEGVELTPYTTDTAIAQGWLDRSGGTTDGVVAKRLDGVYAPGERAMLKVKKVRTADCVVGGFRYLQGAHVVGSLLLGLYDEQGLLHHVGFTSDLSGEDRVMLTARLEEIIEPPGFSGDAPGGPSRWATERSGDWRPLRSELVVEVRFDQITDRRLRHGAGLVRWRPDKSPRQCTFEQLA